MKALALIFILLPAFVPAQDVHNGVFTLKPSLGLNGAQVHGDGYSGFNQAGVFGGAAVNASFSKRASLELGFYFSQKGSRHLPNPEKGDYSFYFLRLNYIDLPLSFRYMLNKNYFVTVGPSLAYLASYEENINYVDFTGMYPFNAFEYGVNAGLGKTIKEKWSVEVRTSNSFMPVRDYGGIVSTVFYPNPIAQFFNQGFYNNVLTLMVSYRIDLKKKSKDEQ